MQILKFGAHLQKRIRGPKHTKFGAISESFKLWPRISPKRMKMSKIGKLIDRLRNFSRVRRKKSGVLWSANNNVWDVHYVPSKSIFSEDHILVPKGVLRLKFVHALGLRLASASHTGSRSPTFFHNWHAKLGLNFSVCTPLTLGIG